MAPSFTIEQQPLPVNSCHIHVKYSCGALEDVFTECLCKNVIKVQKQTNGCGVCSVCYPDSD